jgi:hypothetical protein
MPKKRTAAVARDRDGFGLMPWSRGRKGPVVQPAFNPATFNPASQESLAALNRTLNQAPEVMVKVTGGGRDIGTAQAHVAYIDRHGELDIHTDDGEILNGKDAAKELIDDWGLDARKPGKHRQAPEPGEKDRRAKLIHNIVLSMPRGTPPSAVLEAAKEFAREHFALSHRYAMVLHDPATDLKHEKTQSGKNPHVHLVVKAVSAAGERLYIRKDTLQAWREQFAQALKFQGVAANATPAALRGKPKSSAKGAIHQHQERMFKWRINGQDAAFSMNKPIASEILINRVKAVLKEIHNGVKPDLTGKEKLITTRENVLKDWLETERKLREQGLLDMAGRVVDFVNNLPTVKTGYDLIKDKVVEDIKKVDNSKSVKPPALNTVVGYVNNLESGQAAQGSNQTAPNNSSSQGDDLTPVR